MSVLDKEICSMGLSINYEIHEMITKTYEISIL
jgi:hypothetical protein